MTDNNKADTDMTDGKAAQPANAKMPPFFVGYMPMPAALKKFYWPLSVLLIITIGFAGYWLAAQQKPAAPAIWNTATPVTMEGILTLTPYPVLHRFNPTNPQEIESVLLVGQGKHAADDFVAGFKGQPVAVSGFEIRRGGWGMLEIAGAHAITPTTRVTVAEITRRLAIKSLGDIVLHGEIAGTKCFFGVMKPGSGKIHKACAEVCLLGRIPPILVATDAQNQKFGYLLIRADGSSAAELVARDAAEPVRIQGQLRQQGDLLFIAMDDNGLRRM